MLVENAAQHIEYACISDGSPANQISITIK